VTEIRLPAVAGSFYPGDARTLVATVKALLAAAPPATGDVASLKALVVPHAGYVYSGPTAAAGYALLAPIRDRIRRVVLLGPTHRVAIRGLALPGVDVFETPLGTIPVDAAAVASLADLPQVVTSAAAHAQEHSLEVHLPFLQTALDDFTLVPLAVGRASPDEVAEVLDRLRGGPETLIVVSSDLSHYLPYATAVRTDRGTVADILRLDPHVDHDHACGATPINGLLTLAHRHPLRPALVDLRNSGDTAGDRSGVVGYAAIAFHETDAVAAPDTTDTRGRTLLAIARAAIGRQLGLELSAREDAAFLREPGATFVTLTVNGKLRGCIGSLEAVRPLGDDVKKNARSAAFLDPRFTPLSLREFETVTVEVSLLDAGRTRDFHGRSRSPPPPASRRRRRDPRMGGAARHLPAAGLGRPPAAGELPRASRAEGRTARGSPDHGRDGVAIHRGEMERRR
jgi:AmmeMemoRadiSam system protein B